MSLGEIIYILVSLVLFVQCLCYLQRRRQQWVQAGPDPPTFFWMGPEIRANPLSFLWEGGGGSVRTVVDTLDTKV